MSRNSLFQITIYYIAGAWCFDDARRGLITEPFVLGASEMIDEVIRCSGQEVDRTKKYDITFSTRPFPGWSGSVSRQVKEYDGYWYKLDATDLNGWLCPATSLYFDGHPEKIYVSVTSHTKLELDI